MGRGLGSTQREVLRALLQLEDEDSVSGDAYRSWAIANAIARFRGLPATREELQQAALRRCREYEADACAARQAKDAAVAAGASAECIAGLRAEADLRNSVATLYSILGVWRLRVPTQSSRVFRLKPAIDSDGSQPPIPIEASHL